MSIFHWRDTTYCHSLPKGKRTLYLLGLSLFLFASLPAWGETATEPAQPASSDLTEMSLEALMNINVTSVSRKSQKIANAAAAVFVITQEDIRRSGVTTIADAHLLSSATSWIPR